MSRSVLEWRNRTLAEYRSAAVTAQLLHWCIQAGFPQALLSIAVRIVSDELAHAQRSADVLEALGGDWQAEPVDVEALAEPHAPEGVLASLVDSLLGNFLFGETLAVPLFNAMRVGTTHPVALRVLERVLRDEAIHRAFGWDAFDVLLEIDGDGVRSRVQARLPAVLMQFRHAYYDIDGSPITPQEREVGLLAPDEWRSIFRDTVSGDITARFAARRIEVHHGL